MAAVIYRRLQVGLCRAHTFSSFARWASSKTPNGLPTALQTIKTSDDLKKANSGKPVDRHGSQDACGSGHSREIANNAIGSAEHDYRRQRFAEESNSITNRSPTSAAKTPILVGAKRPRLVEPFRKGRTEKQWDRFESFDTLADPRFFQQSRPEYKSLCYNSEHPMNTSFKESRDLLHIVTHDGIPTTAEISKVFEKLSYLPKKNFGPLKSNPNFEILCKLSTDSLRLYTNAELMSILEAFVRIKIPANHSMLKDYELEFSRRVSNLSTNELLRVADMWRCLSCSVPMFLDRVYSYMQIHCMDLSLAQVIQLIYIIGEGRRRPLELMDKLESMVLRYLNSINVEEVGAVCLGYFKIGNGLSDYLMRKFGDLIIKNVEEISNYSLVNVLKMFRFTRVDHIDFFKKVGQAIPARISSMGTQGIMHVILSFASMHILNEDLMDAVALTIPDRASYCRSKDIAKFLWSFGVLTYEPANADVFYSALTKEIRKNLKEFESFPEHFLTCLMALAFGERFPLDLIKVVLSETFITKSTKISLFELKKDLFTIAGSVQIECPEYKGETILPELQQEVTEMLVNSSNQDIYVKAEFLKAASLLVIMLGGPEYVKNHMILPHTRSKDLEVHLDIYNKPIPFNTDVDEGGIPPLKSYSLKKVDCFAKQFSNKNEIRTSEDGESSLDVDGHEPKESDAVVITEGLRSKGIKLSVKTTHRANPIKLAIQVTNRNHYCYGTKRLLGLHNLKRRQLCKLGYVLVELPHWEWFPLTKRTQSEQLAYLHYKVFNSVTNNDD